MNFTGATFTGAPVASQEIEMSAATVNEVYYATERKAAMLRQAGYQVIENWECDFNQDKKTDPQLKSFLQDLKMVPPLEPREKSLKTNVFIAIFTTAHARLKLLRP